MSKLRLLPVSSLKVTLKKMLCVNAHQEHAFFPSRRSHHRKDGLSCQLYFLSKVFSLNFWRKSIINTNSMTAGVPVAFCHEILYLSFFALAYQEMSKAQSIGNLLKEQTINLEYQLLKVSHMPSWKWCESN